MAIRGDKVTLITPVVIEIVDELVNRLGSQAEVARQAGISRSPLTDIRMGKLTYVHASVLGTLLRLHGGYTTKDFTWYTRAQLAKNFGVKVSKRIAVREIDGIMHRECKHPEHKGERWTPLTEFHYTNGRPRSRCSACETRDKGAEPYWPVDDLIKAAVIECVHRLGKYEASRRIGVAPATLLQIYRGKVRRIQRRTARKILLTWRLVRNSGEVRHKKSINFGAAARGHPERPITSRKDYYIPTGDSENMKRQQKRLRGQP